MATRRRQSRRRQPTGEARRRQSRRRQTRRRQPTGEARRRQQRGGDLKANEVLVARDLMQKMEAADAGQPRIDAATQLFYFLASTQEVLKNERFRETVKRKLKEFKRHVNRHIANNPNPAFFEAAGLLENHLSDMEDAA